MRRGQPSVRRGHRRRGSEPLNEVKFILNPDIERLATTHHSFLGSFSAVSKRNFATKYAFFQVFRDLQNYLADFLKKLQNFAKFCKKSAIFAKISTFSAKIRKFRKNFANFGDFL